MKPKATLDHRIKKSSEDLLKAQINLNQTREARERLLILRDGPLLKNMVGKCFVSDNSYGHGTGWNVYRKILKITPNFTFGNDNPNHYCSTITFQIASHGKGDKQFELKNDDFFYMCHLGKEISVEEYNRNFKRFMKEMLRHASK